MLKDLKILSMGDIHLGHPNTSTEFILDNLLKVFVNDTKYADYDMIVIPGDFYDRLLSYPDLNAQRIEYFIYRLLVLCKKFDIVLRVLEGTPSHDWKQSKSFIKINEMANVGADVKYFDKLEIEYIERFGINVLYIPDEWKPECDDVWMDVQKELAHKDLEQVDFCVMHGAFSYQLPPHVPAPTHDPERYMKLVKYFVFVGHVHKFSVHERIIAAGSFDRLAHNEEEDKGYVEVIARRSGKHEVVFIPNKTAKIYKTLHCKDEDIDKTLVYLDSEIKKLPEESHVKISAGKTHPILVSMETLRNKYPTMRFTTKVDKDPDVSAQSLIDLKNSYQPINITRDNIAELLLKRLEEQGLDSGVIKRAGVHLENFI